MEFYTFFIQNCATPSTAVIVFFGANDAALLGRTSQRQHVPTDEYKENLCKIVNHLKVCIHTKLDFCIFIPEEVFSSENGEK